MLIKHLQLKNWGRHTELTADTNSAIMGLLGANGSGKSTILKAIEFAFTGTLADRAETYVKGYGSPDGAANGSVTLTFSKNGVDGTIFRQVGKTPKRELTWDGNTIKKASEVDKTMVEILGADKLALSNAVFISQGELDKILFGSQTERETLFAKLLLVGHFSKICDYIKKRIAGLKEGLQDFGAVEDELRTQRVTAETSLFQLESNSGNFPSFAKEIDIIRSEKAAAAGLNDSVDKVNEYVRTITETRQNLSEICKGRTLAEWSSELGQAVCQLNEGRATLAAHKLAASRYETFQSLSRQKHDLTFELKEVNALLKPLGSSTTLADQLSFKNGQLAALEERDRALKLRDCLLERAASAKKTLSAFLAVPPAIPDGATLVAWTSELEANHRQLFELRLREGLLEQASKCSSPTCPVCGSANFKLPESNAAQIDSLAKATATLTEKIQKANTASQAYAFKSSSLNTAVLQAGEEVQAAQSAAEIAQSVVAATGGSLEALQEEIDGLRATLQNLGRLEQQRHTLEDRISGVHRLLEEFNPQVLAELGELLGLDGALLEARLAANAEVIEASKEMIMKVTPMNQELNRLETLLTAEQERSEQLRKTLQELRGSYTELIKKLLKEGKTLEEIQMVVVQGEEEHQQQVGRIKESRAAVAGIVARQAELGRRMEAESAKRALISDGERMAAIFDRGGLTAAYIRYRFAQLADLTREYLAKMESDFSVDLDPEVLVSFTFTRTDDDSGYAMEQSKLSGGQRVRLTVAFLLAVQKLIIPEVGFMVLDEPTVHLDAPGVESLRNLISDMSRHLENVDSQVWICDHNPVLDSAFGKTIRL